MSVLMNVRSLAWLGGALVCLGVGACSGPVTCSTGQAKGIHPAVDASGEFLIGGTVNGGWKLPDAIAPMMKGGETYKLYTLTGPMGTATGKKPTVEAPGDYQCVELKPKLGESRDVIGIAAPWDAQPRKPKIGSKTQKAYVDAVRSFLAAQGLKSVPINLTQVIRVDLEGDGVDEVLLSATTPRKGYSTAVSVEAKKGDYSLILLRRVVRGKVVTQALAYEVYPKGLVDSPPDRYRVSAVLDLNGDGILEIIVDQAYYEGEGKSVFQLKGGKAVEVIGGGVGA